MTFWVAGAVVGSAVIGGVAANKASKAQLQASRESSAAQSATTEKSIEAQAAALEKSIESQERMFERQVGLQEPFRQVGVNALPDLVAASYYDPFTIDKFQADPGYGFRLKEGLRALENSAAARGGLLSGNAMRGITRYGQGLASEEFGNAFNRYQTGFASRLNPLQALTGVGQTSSNTLTGAAGNLGAGMAGAYGQFGAGTASAYGNLGSALAANAINAGNARASGYMGTANALSSAVGQGLNYYQNQQLMDIYRNRG
jgi:hypothetical protein